MDTDKEKVIEYVAKNKEEKISLVVLIAILIAGLLIGGAIFYKGDKNNAGQERENTNKTGEIKEISADDDPLLGSDNALLTIVNFSDFRCGYCARLALVAEKEIIEKYVKTGKAKFVARDYAFLSQDSFLAAEAANCANEQGKFWEYREYLFSRQSEISKENLKKFAKEIGLSSSQFDVCVESRKYKGEVEKDNEDAVSYGVSSTPSTFINGELILGSLPFSEFEKVIEAKLK